MSIVLDSDWDHRGGDGFAKVGNKGPENCGQCPTGSIPAIKGSLLDRLPIGTFKMSYPVIRSGPRRRVFYFLGLLADASRSGHHTLATFWWSPLELRPVYRHGARERQQTRFQVQQNSI